MSARVSVLVHSTAIKVSGVPLRKVLHFQRRFSPPYSPPGRHRVIDFKAVQAAGSLLLRAALLRELLKAKQFIGMIMAKPAFPPRAQREAGIEETGRSGKYGESRRSIVNDLGDLDNIPLESFNTE